MTLLHRLAHYFGWNYGTIETWWEGPRLMVGFRCTKCGKIDGAHDSRVR